MEVIQMTYQDRKLKKSKSNASRKADNRVTKFRKIKDDLIRDTTITSEEKAEFRSILPGHSHLITIYNGIVPEHYDSLSVWRSMSNLSPSEKKMIPESIVQKIGLRHELELEIHGWNE
jgi:hypothetical protein